MVRTKQEIATLANALVSSVIADSMFEFPGVRKAIQKLDDEQWNAFVNEKIEQVTETLLDKFDSAD